MYLPFLQFKSNTACVCGLAECKDILSQFRQLNDLRGQVQTLPNPQSKTKTDLAKNKRQYMNRLTTHCTKAREALKSQVNESHIRLLRSNVTERKEAYIALWHFDKKVLERISIDDRTMPLFIPVNIAIESQLYHNTGGSLYSKADQCPHIIRDRNNKGRGTEIALVPTYYDATSALQDVKDAKASKEEHDAKLVATESHARRTRETGPRSHSSSSIVSPTPRTGSASGDSNKRHKSNTNTVPKVMSNDLFTKLTKERQLDELDRLRKELEDYSTAMDGEIDQIREKKEEADKLVFVLQQTIAGDEQRKVHKNLSFTELAQQQHDDQEKLRIQLEVLAQDGSGLNRISMTTKTLFESNEKLCKQLYGFPDFVFLIDFLESAFDVKYEKPKNVNLQRGKADGGLREFEQILLTLLWTNTYWYQDVIGVLFGIKSNKTVANYINRWLPLLGECGDMLSSLLPFMDATSFEALEPESYIDMNLRMIGALVDGKDFLTETVRSDRVLNCALASNKMHHSAFRVLTWSLPCGAVIERTPAFFGRASEKALMNTWGKLGRLKFPFGYMILGDKGFDNTATCYVNYNTTLHPAFLTNDQFNQDQGNHNITICQKRYSCETVYSRVTDTVKLSGVYRREHFQHFEALVGWAHGRANICYGYLQKVHS